MHDSSRKGSLSSAPALGKVACGTGVRDRFGGCGCHGQASLRPAAGLARARGILPAMVTLAVLASLLPACCLGPAGRTVRLTDLEHAPRVLLPPAQRITVSDPKMLHELCTPLGPRLGLLQVRSAADWTRLAEAAPGLGPCPDLRAGTVIGLACWAGTTLDGRWPLRIDGVRLYHGAGLIEANFHGGTFLPDGQTTLETAYVPGLAAILAADVNGTTFCP